MLPVDLVAPAGSSLKQALKDVIYSNPYAHSIFQVCVYCYGFLLGTFQALYLGPLGAIKRSADFCAIYAVVALCYFLYEFPTGRNWRQLTNYFLPREIWSKRSFRLDIYWTMLTFTPITALITKVLASLFFLAYVPTVVNALSLSNLTSLSFIRSTLENSAHHDLFVFLIALISFDFASYWTHRFTHTYEFLWQFHKVHHYSEQLNYFAVERMHPVDSFLSFSCNNAFMALVLSIFFPVTDSIFNGAGAFSSTGGVLAMVFIVLNFINRLNHSHFPVSFGSIVNKIVVSPSFHLLHHSKLVVNKNFGSTLSIWDTLFRTSVLPGQISPEVDHRNFLGVDGMGDDYFENIAQWLYKPFVDAFNLVRSKVQKNKAEVNLP